MKILYVTTISNTVNAFLIPHIKMLVDQGHHVDVAFNIEQEIKPEIKEMGCKIYELPFDRNPFKKNNYIAYKCLKKIINKEKYDIVHTHTPVASACVRLACKNIKNTKVFYTAHGFHFFKGAPIKNWLLYYPIELWLSKYTDVLITINNEDYNRAKKKFKAKRVEYIPGVGLDIDKFKNVKIDRNIKRKEIGVPADSFVILSVGELNKNKNHEVIIKALAKLNNTDIHYVICGQGPLYDYLKSLSKEFQIEEHVHLFGYRTDIAEICNASDVFAFPSLREGLGMAALEAMACGLPIITSNVHGILDYSINGETGYISKPNSIEIFSESILKLYLNFNERKRIGKNNQEKVKKYGLENCVRMLIKIYE